MPWACGEAVPAKSAVWGGGGRRGYQAGRSVVVCAAGDSGHEARWWRRYDQLMAYKKRHGDCLVPRGYSDNPALGRWVSTQRLLHNKNDLNPERKVVLDALGFEWDPLETQW